MGGRMRAAGGDDGDEQAIEQAERESALPHDCLVCGLFGDIDGRRRMTGVARRADL